MVAESDESFMKPFSSDAPYLHQFYAVTWSDKERDKNRRMNESTTNQLNSSEDILGKLLVWRPTNGYGEEPDLLAILTLWFGLVGAALLLKRQ
ncbi:hypothetical protein F2Q70_00039020 [Brassica cretica]|uniref:Uncharacterized protein n=1 Tax=Brassica cretica TaxID=69181 RepID=A0A8S9K974_BRACR|nr:hypothetical protein F2Q70_00039020 [Brassica cretica]KAF2616567.1 hypothetical protein F2Q68_00039691 [Brassica cretica]